MRRSSRGSALLEFALALPLLTILVFGTIDGARVFATWNRVKNAAHEGASYAQYYPVAQASGVDCPDPDNIPARAHAEGSDLTVTISPAASPACQLFSLSSPVQPGQSVTVKVSVPFVFITPFAGALWGNPVVRASVTVTAQG